jgi:hypothetical protein
MAQNSFTNLLAVAEVLNDDDLYEQRIENDSTGKILYVGKTITPSASTALKIWYIKKIGYDSNGFLNYVQLPVDGIGFLYSWDLRATYF